MKSVLENIGVVLILAIFGFAFLVITSAYAATDSTDFSWTERSGVNLIIDAKTGCHYLEGSFSGITPRVDAVGNHICTGKE